MKENLTSHQTQNDTGDTHVMQPNEQRCTASVGFQRIQKVLRCCRVAEVHTITLHYYNTKHYHMSSVVSSFFIIYLLPF
jgi:hypothetical protein